MKIFKNMSTQILNYHHYFVGNSEHPDSIVISSFSCEDFPLSRPGIPSKKRSFLFPHPRSLQVHKHLRLSQMSPCLGALVTGRQPRVGGTPFVCPPFLLREHFLPWQPVSLFGPSPTTIYLHPIQPYRPRHSSQNMPSSRLLHKSAFI